MRSSSQGCWKRAAQVSAIVLSGFAGAASAQDAATKVWVPEAATAQAGAAATATEPDGWKLKLRFGSNASTNYNRDVVGSTNGSTIQLGLVLEGAANLKSGQHEWLNSIAIKYQQSRSPAIDNWQKSMDDLTLESTYLYHLASVPWIGPFGRLRLNTAMFPGYVTQGEPYVVLLDGQQIANHSAGAGFQTTGAFEPLTLRESIGFFAEPTKDPAFETGLKLGAGVQQLIVRQGYGVVDAGTAGQVTVTELQDVLEAGAEFEAGAKGQLNELVGYSVLANFLLPVVTTAETDLEGMDLLNSDIQAKVSAKLSTWGSLDYVASLKKQPLVADVWQIQNGLLFSAGVDLL